MNEINLSDVLQTGGTVIDLELPMEAELFQRGDGAYTITEMEPLALSLRNKEKGKAVIQGKTAVCIEMPCDRCLKPVKTQVDIAFDREIAAPELLEADPDQAEDQTFVDGYTLTPDRLLQEEIIMNLPVKILCREDCKGICKVCGHDLNEGECGCDTFVPDPRMAAIADLFK